LNGIELAEGENTFFAIAQDTAGNESGQSNRIRIVFDVLPPPLDIFLPRDGQEFYGESKRMVEINGQSDPAAEVKVNAYFAVVSASGTFSKQLRLEEGENRIKIEATDLAGNTTSKTISVRYSP
jgi:bacillopeptidase F